MGKLNVDWTTKVDKKDNMDAEIFNRAFKSIQKAFDELEEIDSYPRDVIEFSNGIQLKVEGDDVFLLKDGVKQSVFIQTKDEKTYVFAELANISRVAYEADSAAYAESASMDEDGNVIHEHYATKEEVGNAIKSSTSGEIIHINDISPIEHDITVKLTSKNDPYFDPTTTTLTVCGKNLFDVNIVSYAQNIGVNPIDMVYGSVGSIDRGTHYIPCRPNTTYTFSKSVGTFLRFSCSPEVPAMYGTITKTFASSNNIATITTGENDRFISFSLISTAEEGVISYDQVLPTCQLEVGPIATNFKPFNGTTYTPNEDGIVEGVKSIYPSMTMYTDTSGVVVNAEYNADTKKYIDNKFAELQALVLEG